MTPAQSALLDALGDPTRRAILARISHGPVPVSAIARPLGISITAVGQHLRILEAAALAQSEKQGRTRLCRLRPDGLVHLEHWARDCRRAWEARLDRIGTVLDSLPD